jgi:hypothetical protein
MAYKTMKLDPSHSKKVTGMREPTHYVMTDHKDGKPPSRTLHYSASEAEAHVRMRKQMSPHKTSTIFAIRKSGQDTKITGKTAAAMAQSDKGTSKSHLHPLHTYPNGG